MLITSVVVALVYPVAFLASAASVVVLAVLATQFLKRLSGPGDRTDHGGTTMAGVNTLVAQFERTSPERIDDENDGPRRRLTNGDSS
jgi:membrane protein implicated in regulation of membrane protease activity